MTKTRGLRDSQRSVDIAEWERVSSLRSTICVGGHDSGYNSLRPLFFRRRFGRVVWWHDSCGLPLASGYIPPSLAVLWKVYGPIVLWWRFRDGLAWLSSRCVRNVDAHLWI